MGASMNPIFRDGDALNLVPCNGHVRVGDVIVFKPPQGDRKIIHRVIAVGPEGVRTRGDNNGSVDPWDLKPHQIIGRVVSLRRNGKEISIPGGFRGRLQESVVRLIRRADKAFSNLFRGAYHRLARSRFARRFLHGRFATRVITVNRPQGMEYQLLVGNHLAGWFRPGEKSWTIRRPYLLFVDEEALPMNRDAFSSGVRNDEMNLRQEKLIGTPGEKL